MSLKEIEDIGGQTIIVILSSLLLFAPGVLILFAYFPNLITDLDVFKLFILSGSFIIPSLAFVIPSMTTLAELYLEQNDDPDTLMPEQVVILTLSLLLSSSTYFVCLVLCRLFGFSFTYFVTLTGSITIMVCVLLLLSAPAYKKRLKPTTKTRKQK